MVVIACQCRGLQTCDKAVPLKTLKILSFYHEKSFSQGQTGAARSGKKKRKKGGTKPKATASVEDDCL